MDRRDFIKSSGIIALAASVPSVADAKVRKSPKGVTLKHISMNDGWDVIVCGGGPSGCTAACAAAREGARVLLIESTGAIGGMSTSGLVNAWAPFTDGEKRIYKGLAERIFLEARKGVPHVDWDYWVPINHEYLKVVYDDILAEFGVSVLFFSTIASVEMKDKETVEAVIVANKAGLTAYKAKIFIDCTGDGDVATWAGADYLIGDENGEMQPGSLCFTIAGVNHDAYSQRPPIDTGNKNSPIFRMIDSGKYDLIDSHFIDKMQSPGYLGFNAGHVQVDGTDPMSLSKAMAQGRKIARQYRDGLAEFESESFGGSILSSTASLLGIREGRRIKCDYIFTVDDWLARKEFEDGIGRNAYYIDVHQSDAVKYPHYGVGESHGIPYRCLTPTGLKNVLVAGRCISTDRYAYGSLRVMPPAMVTGEAAGVAAGLICKSVSPDVHSVDTALLRKRLHEEGQLL